MRASPSCGRACSPLHSDASVCVNGIAVHRRAGDILEVHELRDVVRAAGLHAGAEARLAHAAERLAQHDCARGDAVDVEVAGADVALPVVPLALVETLETAGEAVARLVHQRDRLAQPLETHHGQHRPEELGHVRVAAGSHAVLDSRRPQARVALDGLRHDSPFLTGLEHLERGFEIARGRLDHRSHLGVELPGGADLETLHRLAQRAPERRVVVDLGLQQQQRGRGALLAGVAEGRMQDVLDGEVPIRDRGDDRRILAAGLGEQVEARIVVQHRQRRLGAAGQDHRVDLAGC